MIYLAVAGGCVAIGASVLIGAWLIWLSWQVLLEIVERLETRGEKRQLDWQQQKLRSAAWWFSEDKVTMTLLQDLAEMNEWQARDKWRKGRLAVSEGEP